MKKSWKRPKSAIADDNHCESLLQQLMVIFPNGDPGYFRECLQYYESDHITRVTDKIFEMGGYYPMVTTCDPVKQLNHALRILATDLFPDCEVAYLRQRLLQYNHSHLEQVSDELLNEQARLPERLEYAKISRSDMFRSETYKSQAQTQLAIDYPQAWKSSIRAVLAENNWDYLNSYDQLREIGPGGLWIALRNFVKHWIIPGTGSSSSSNAASSSSHHGAAPQTSSFDPDFMEDMEALRRRHLCAQEMTDSELARQINEDEYTKENQLITCNCCYGDFAFEQLAFCSEGEHTFCHDCITHYISEGLFGQGSLRGAARIGCISVEGCQGSFSTEMLERILTSDIWSAYQHSLFEESIVRACRSVVRCAACSYCEVDESIRPLDDTKSRLSYVLTAAQLLLMVVVAVMCFLQNSIIPMLTTLVYCYTFAQWDLQADLEIVYGRIARARRGSIFRCQNQACAEMTCLQCNRVARGLHNCLERDQDGLRLYVEKAMADAVTRTCPVCNVSFQKADGCNKITCRCGYSMCYVCRKDIGKESYKHFCNHFREIPGRACNQCAKCDLYKSPSEDEAVRNAAERAKAEYLRAHPQMAAQEPHVIGPVSTFRRIDDFRRESVLWLLQRCISWVV